MLRSVHSPSKRRLIALFSSALLVGGLLALAAPSARAEDPGHQIATKSKPARPGAAQSAAARIQATGTGHITGTVTAPGGAGVGDVDVWVFADGGQGWDYTEYGDVTADDGSYDVSGLPAGTYRLEFEDEDRYYAPEYYSDAPTVESAEDIVVASDETVSGKDAELGQAGHITGKVIAPDGAGLSDIDIYVFKQVGEDFQFVNLDFTDETGVFDLSVAPGAYRIWFVDEYGEFADEFYKNVDNPDDATDVSVDAGARAGIGNVMLGTLIPNVWKSTAKVTVSAYRHGNVSVSCTQACSGYAQVWSDASGTQKSSAKYFSMTKAGYKTLAFTDLPYVNSTTAKVRIAKKAPDESPNPQFNNLQLVKGPQNVVRTTSWTKVSASGKATVNISCTMACEGYAQLRSDQAGDKRSTVFHYKLAKAGYTAMYFSGVPNIDSSTWLTRLAITSPSTSATPQFDTLKLVRTPVPVNTLKTTPKVTVSSAGTATVNLSCTIACEGYVQLRKTTSAGTVYSNVVHYKLSTAGWIPMRFTGLVHESSTEWKTRVAITSPVTTTTPIFLPLQLVAG